MAKTVTGYEVRGGTVKLRTLYATKAEAAAHVAASKLDTCGFGVRNGSIVATISRFKRGKWHHQEVGGSGLSWSSWVPPYPSRDAAVRAILKSWQSDLKHRKQQARQLERQIKRGVK